MRHQRRIDELRDRVTGMGQLSMQMVRETLSSLGMDDQQSRQNEVMIKEGHLDQLQLELDKEAVAIITLFNPVAHNLRFLLTATRVTSELERIGDQAVNICTYARIAPPSETTISATQKMGELVLKMIDQAVASFANEDAESALATIVMDDELDQLDREISAELLKDTSELADRTTALLISQALERMGDQATNICEDVIFAVKGKDIRHSPLLNLLNGDIVGSTDKVSN